MADEIFGTYIENLPENIQEAVLDSYEEVLKEKADSTLSTLKTTTPKGDTGNLVNSLKMSKITKTKKNNKIGYKITYDGYDNKGRPYQVIANSLNRGFVNPKGVQISGKHFIDQAVAKLKGMDQEIADRFESKCRDIDKNGEANK